MCVFVVVDVDGVHHTNFLEFEYGANGLAGCCSFRIDVSFFDSQNREYQAAAKAKWYVEDDTVTDDDEQDRWSGVKFSYYCKAKRFSIFHFFWFLHFSHVKYIMFRLRYVMRAKFMSGCKVWDRGYVHIAFRPEGNEHIFFAVVSSFFLLWIP